MSRFRFLIALVFIAAPAFADAVYSYTGAPFDTETGTPLYLADPRFKLGESIDLTVDFSTPLAPGLVSQSVLPISYSLVIGSDDFTSPGGSGESSVLETSIFTTDSSGRIIDWSFSIIGGGTLFPISTSGTLGDSAGVFGPDFGGSASTKTIGIWTAPAAVPEPSNLNLLIPGLVALFFLVKRRSRA